MVVKGKEDMMSEYFFGCHEGHLTRRAGMIARRVGGPDVGHINYTEPDGRMRGWFFGPNYGAPFDGILARKVMDAIDAAGGIDGLRRKR